MRKIIAVWQIYLMISMSFCFAILMNVDKVEAVEGDLQAYTCVVAKNEAICQQYSSLDECKTNCAEECLPVKRDKVADCIIGTCYDNLEGTCQAGSPKLQCENFGGKFFKDIFENIEECQEGCCVLGDETLFSTEQQCKLKSTQLGLEEINFKSEIVTELGCLALSYVKEEGACIFPGDVENICEFVTKEKCILAGGDFQKGKLCSEPTFKTECKPRASIQCVEGDEDVYWFDSCGNKEIVYDKSKEDYSSFDYNIFNIEEYCIVGTPGSPISNQGDCGNCNYLLGSVCGEKTSDEKLNDKSANVVCKDLRCVDSAGRLREHGESWCVYQGAIGVDNGRSIDTPGSRHFKETCWEGEIIIDPCADYRNEICVQSDSEFEGGKFSSAACRTNMWQKCISINSENSPGEDASESENAKAQDDLVEECLEYPDCYVKKIDVSESFKFNMCVPKYPPGFDLNGDAGNICSLATQECTWVKVSDLFSSDEYNKECKTSKFTEELNDLCMSLGDCGSSVNYVGSLTENYNVGEVNDDKIKKSDGMKLTSNYLSAISNYHKAVRGEFADAGDVSEYFASLGLGIPDDLGDIPEGFDSQGTKVVDQMGMIAGASGVALIAASYTAFGYTYFGAAAASLLPGAHAGAAFTGAINTNILAAGGQLSGSGMAGFGGAMAGAIIGMVVAYILLKVTGNPQSKAGGMITMISAGIAGAALGYSVATGAGLSVVSASGGVAWIPVIGWVFAAIAILNILMGDKEEKTYRFECLPWRAPNGGNDCDKCGKDGLPCSYYTCSSLGKTCKFINEGTTEERCVDVSPKDVKAPDIKINKEILESGITAEEMSSGAKIKSSLEKNCFKEYSKVKIGLEMNEPASCKFDEESTRTIGDMSNIFGETYFVEKQEQEFLIPSLESLGISSYNPDAKAEYDVKIRCQDASGNSNSKEYVVEMCIIAGEDETPPVINKHLPEEISIKKTSKFVDLSVYVSEPADCRWAKESKLYSEMPIENNFICLNSYTQQTSDGWMCGAKLPITKDEERFYVACLDQPNNEIMEERNPSRVYDIDYERTQEDLKINIISPQQDSTIFSGTSVASVEILLETSGGYNDEAICRFKSGTRWIEFRETASSQHSQIFENYNTGNKILEIECEDGIGNKAIETLKFRVEQDNSAPIISRAYKLGGDLMIVTTENAICSYVTQKTPIENKCSFKVDDENATSMSGEEFVHSTSLDEEDTYYIKCKDGYNNEPGNCNIIIKEGYSA
jgi:hypothetical protein